MHVSLVVQIIYYFTYVFCMVFLMLNFMLARPVVGAQHLVEPWMLQPRHQCMISAESTDHVGD